MLKLLAIPVLAALTTAVLVPPPSGPYSVVTNVHPLTDESRQDPYAPEDKRRILVSTFFPVDSSSCEDEDAVTPYLLPQTEAVYAELLKGFGLPAELLSGFEVGYCSPKEVPAENESTDGFPLVILSPGFTGSRLFYAVQARALASMGYAVVTLDHPYDSLIVEFPDGSIVTGPAVAENDTAGLVNLVQVRAQDISFLIDQLEESPSLGSDTQVNIDFSNIIAIGHSLGGATSAAASINDERILGGIDFDGQIRPPVSQTDLSKPFLLVGVFVTLEETHVGWSDFYEGLMDAKMLLGVNGTTHYSFWDLSYLITLKDVPAELVPYLQAALGTIDGGVMFEIFKAITDGFAQLVFGGKAGALKDIDQDFEQVVSLEEKFPGSC